MSLNYIDKTILAELRRGLESCVDKLDREGGEYSITKYRAVELSELVKGLEDGTASVSEHEWGTWLGSVAGLINLVLKEYPMTENERIVWMAPEQVEQRYGRMPTPAAGVIPLVLLVLACGALAALLCGCDEGKRLTAALALPDGRIVGVDDMRNWREPMRDDGTWVSTSRFGTGADGKAKR